MSLSDLELQDEYRSDKRDLIQDFYIPCLEKSVIYNRAVGYFSSSSMAAAARGLTALIRSGGKMQLIASPQLSPEDAKAIEQGLKQREEVIDDTLLQELETEFDQIVHDRLACLAWLLARGLLEIRLAIPKKVRNRGIYHEKVGIFADSEGNFVTFMGSANESYSALIENFECIDVYWSWDAALQTRALRKVENFQRLWNNRTENLDVLEFPEAAKRSLLKLCPQDSPSMEPRVLEPSGRYSISHSFPDGVPTLPSGLELRPYQQQAVANWFANKGRGTLKMATGSGKTITALAITAMLYEKIELQALIVVCPYRHLVKQWARECQKFGLEPVLAYESAKLWDGELSNQLINLKSGLQAFVAVVTTNATLITNSFQAKLSYFPPKTLIIGDEVHNLGARKLEASLPRKTVGLRLALSATPERYFDDRGTQAVFKYFGPVLQPEFTLRDAIEQGALVHYLYFPILVKLTENEIARYVDLSSQIGRAIVVGGEGEDNEALTALLAKRARLVGAAENKLEALRTLMAQRLNTDHTLFYCGDGSVEDEITQESMRQLELVARLLGVDLKYRVNTYTAETPLDEREDLRKQFENGELQGLVAIRCLDEGVDIPAIQTAVILASSSNPRQFVQRRGRILRRHPDKQRATLFDMIVVPPDLGREYLETERNLLRKELQRFAEFADLADNSAEARIKLLPLQERFGLMDI
ncbi:DNA phosphorothioation system restriction enzyme [Trichocoleus sp. FACHB-591]|uniref:DNA phosphorothioation system restriction enzyme n=1 Tax=Trichocoleus sp. FACHB-591 TaxID=2692872 RepID=UPI00168246DE|nr:DNA phosphorothioation system restriction enzyme [Trichocoleus sp. FACHB-591]MBD2094477.1 DNA phosphorothioation system restriction enzyme [Trichocoleus sp. FACHB-591]